MNSAASALAITLVVFAASSARSATHDDAAQMFMPRSIDAEAERATAGFGTDPVKLYADRVKAKLHRLRHPFR